MFVSSVLPEIDEDFDSVFHTELSGEKCHRVPFSLHLLNKPRSRFSRLKNWNYKHKLHRQQLFLAINRFWPIKSFWAEYSGLIKIAKSDLTKYHGLSYRDDPVDVWDGDELGLGRGAVHPILTNIIDRFLFAPQPVTRDGEKYEWQNYCFSFESFRNLWHSTGCLYR